MAFLWQREERFLVASMDREQLQDWLEQHRRFLLGTLGVFAVLSLVGWTLPQRHSLGSPFLYFYQTDMGIIVDCIG
ncbi:MAG: hypothetical protein SVU32_08955, partial [Candidatus Nanohaloarchaea archaeon]|nr:hypothetical protein [Candidatus Nanohaloarchaea archaeon]